MISSRAVLTLLAIAVLSVGVAACSPKTAAPAATPAVEEQMIQNDSSSPQGSTENSGGEEVVIQPTYESPAGPEEVKFTLVLDADGTITESNTEVLGKSPISQQWQGKFGDGLATAIVGKKLADLGAVDRLGGSSLTSAAFNKALPELKQQAAM